MMMEAPSQKFPRIAQFKWDKKRSAAAIALASGKTQEETAEEVRCSRRTLHNWLKNNEFAAEVDRLSLMIYVASRAERLRITARVIRQKTVGNIPVTEKDLLEWLKFAQSETDGIKLDLTKLAALAEDDAPVANQRSAGTQDETVH